MVFSLGNLLVLGIVLVILAVYRRLDTNSRSLEKVRKYADKAREDLDGILAEKVRNLKDLAIELEVHQKAAKEILKRSHGIEEVIQDKFAAADTISSRINEYDRVLDELVQMTRRAEENIGRIKEESEFTDSVAKRIRAAADKLDEQESRIPQMVARFREENTEALKEAQDVVVEEAASRVGEISDNLAAASTKAEEISMLMSTSEAENRRSADRVRLDIQNMGDEVVEKVSADFSRIEAEYGVRLEEAARRGEALETKALIKLKEHIEEKLKGMSRELSGRIDANRNEFEQKMESLGGFIAGIRMEAEKDLETIKAENSASFQEYKSILRDKIDELEGSLYQAEQSIEEKIGVAQERSGLMVDSMETRINQDIETKTEGLQADMDRRLSQLHQSSEASREKIESMFGSLNEKAESWSSRLEETITGMARRVEEFDRNVDTLMTERTTMLDSNTAETQRRLAGFEMDISRRTDALQKLLDSAEETVRERANEVSGRADSLMDETLASIRTNIEVISAEGEKLGGQVLERCRGIAEENEVRVRGHIDSLSEQIRRADSLGVEISEKMKSLRENMSAESKNMDAAIRRFVQEHETRLMENGEAMETRVMGDLESRLGDYEKNITYRFSRIEEVFGEIDNLEKTLRGSMDRISARLREDFGVFGKDLHEKRLADKAELEKTMLELRAAMDEVEQGLADLKNRAYENVSEKLKVFEDDFFRDLRSRDETMQEKFSDWQSRIDSTLEVLARENAEERNRVEAGYAEELKTRFGDYQGRFNLHLENLDSQVGDFQRNLSSRMESSQMSVDTFRQEMLREMEEAKSGSVSFFREEYSRYSTSIGEEFEKFRRDYDVRLRGMADDLDGRERDLSGILESVRSDVTVWQAGVLQNLKDSEAGVNNQFAGLKVGVSDSISALRDEFTTQKNEIIEESREERGRLKEDLRALGEGVSSLEEDLHRRTEEALGAFRSGYQEFQEDYSKKNKDLQTEADTKIRAFRSVIQDTRQQFETLHQKLFGSIEESSKLLSVNLAEIDKRQKNFIEQTKIFERADSLKIALQENIEDLKADLAKADSQRREMKELEIHFLKIKKLGEEVTEKMSRFTAEKRRIDTLEADYERLIGMSESVEKKLQQVSESDDGIQTIQATLRSLESLQTEVEARFERLEKKRKVLDLTTEGVEKNFLALDELGKRLDACRQEIDAIPESLESLDERIKTLASGREKADQAITRLNSIDTLLKDLEKRTENMQRVREWLAKTETRIEEISRDAQEQVKLLGTLLKDGAKSGAKKEKGAPPLSSRETVTKLAHQGWTVEQIAMATKLSRGEVELILELTAK